LLSSSEHDNSNLTHENAHQEFRVDDATLNRFADEYGFIINDQLSPELRLILLHVLYKRKEAFAKSLADLKSYNKQELEINLNSPRPLIKRQFKTKAEYTRILQHHIDEWQKHGVIEDSTNYSFRSPLFLVSKPSLKGTVNPLDPKHYQTSY
jgi:hypothetical protein